MPKDFDGWNERKKSVHASEHDPTFFFHEREVWWCAVGINVGVETDGKHTSFERPILIVKKFNADMFWGLPMTSQNRFGKFFRMVRYESGTSTAILSQLRTMSTKRLLRKVGMIPEDEFRAILEILKGYLTLE
jgi:mRNA interferase MazF